VGRRRQRVGILKLDLERKSIAVIQPPVDVFTEGKYEFSVVRAESGGLGFLFASRTDWSIQLWKRKTRCDGGASWVLDKTIKLDKLIPPSLEHLHVVGFGEDNNVVILWIGLSIFMIHLDSLQLKKLPYPNMIGYYHPLECVYAPGNSMPLHISNSIHYEFRMPLDCGYNKPS
jgi:hypothetical protein